MISTLSACKCFQTVRMTFKHVSTFYWLSIEYCTNHSPHRQTSLTCLMSCPAQARLRHSPFDRLICSAFCCAAPNQAAGGQLQRGDVVSHCEVLCCVVLSCVMLCCVMLSQCNVVCCCKMLQNTRCLLAGRCKSQRYYTLRWT